MLHPRENKYLPIFALLTLIITLQSFLIGEDQKQSDFAHPIVSASTSFVNQARPTSEGAALGATAPVLSRASFTRPISSGETLMPAGPRKQAASTEPFRPVTAAGTTCTTTCEVDVGDNIWRLARRYGISPEEILMANRLTQPTLTPGQVLVIPLSCGPAVTSGDGVTTVKDGETAIDVASRLGIPLVDLVRENDLSNLYEIPPGTVLRFKVEPEVKAAPQPAPTRRQPRQTTSDRRGLLSPVVGALGDRFGWRDHPVYHDTQFHTGVDLKAAHGTLIKASQDGRVIFAGWFRNYGRTVVIRHAGGLTTRYAHCSTIFKKIGDRVRRGDKIAKVGTSGLTTGPHVHFEVRRDGKALDPLKYLTRRREHTDEDSA